MGKNKDENKGNVPENNSKKSGEKEREPENKKVVSIWDKLTGEKDTPKTDKAEALEEKMKIIWETLLMQSVLFSALE